MKLELFGEQSDRLHFRKLRPEDAPLWEPMFEVKQNATFLGMDATKTAAELREAWFKKCFERYENELGGMNVLIHKETGAFIGQCGLLVQNVEGVEYLEVGYSILPEFWGQGYASEAAQKCRDYCFENNFRDHLISIVHVDNIASETVARKNGMSLYKHVPDYKGIQVNIFRIERAQWAKIKG